MSDANGKIQVKEREKNVATLPKELIVDEDAHQ
jgi:hypothetical protein